jgi:hypothetical protein
LGRHGGHPSIWNEARWRAAAPLNTWRDDRRVVPFFNHGRRGNRFQTALAPKPFDPLAAHAPDKMILLSMILQTFPGCWSLMVSEACLVKVGDEHGNGGWFGWVSRFGY